MARSYEAPRAHAVRARLTLGHRGNVVARRSNMLGGWNDRCQNRVMPDAYNDALWDHIDKVVFEAGVRIRRATAGRVPRKLYHYTSLTGFTGIIQAGCIWCSDVAFANDPAEVVYGDEVVARVMAERTKREQ